MRVIVTNGETRPALAITRSLGRRGHDVIVAAARHPSLASASRFCRTRVNCPDPMQHGRAFATAMVETAIRSDAGLLLPVNEVATTLLADRRDELPTTCCVPLPASSSLHVANDKSLTLELARRLGVPIPRTTALARGQPLPPGLSYPVVAKPARSRALSPQGWLSGGTAYASDEAQLLGILESTPSELHPVLLQERLTGTAIGMFACYWHGRPVAFFSHQRLREKPPSGGVSVLCQSIALDPAATEYARSLLDALDWHGVAMVEFKRDNRDGTLRLMELNGRFWGSLQLAIDAGVDFPAMIAALAQGRAVESPRQYRLGVRSRWFIGDLDALLALWSKPAGSLALPPGHPGRWRSLAAFLNFWQPAQRSEVFRLTDPRPGLLEMRQWLAGR